MSRNNKGYGLKWSKEERRLLVAHRIYYERVHGPIPDGLQIDHLCRVRACVNPAHLEAVTPRVNNERKHFPDGRPLRAAEPPRVRSVDPAECVLWQGALDRDGYGKRMVQGKTVAVHRWAYERANGSIPAGMEIDHLCRNRRCYNPEHLDAVTQRENRRRAAWRQSCIHGHVLTAENTLWHGDRRRCRTCQAEANVRYRRRRRERRERERGRADDTRGR
jgi:hypothetical protein